MARKNIDETADFLLEQFGRTVSGNGLSEVERSDALDGLFQNLRKAADVYLKDGHPERAASVMNRAFHESGSGEGLSDVREKVQSYCARQKLNFSGNTL